MFESRSSRLIESAAVEMLTRSTYVIMYITHSSPRTTVVGFGRLKEGIREAIDYINEIQTTGRHRRLRLGAVSGHHDVRRRGRDLENDRWPRSDRPRRHRASRTACRHQ